MRLGFDATSLSPSGKGLARVQYELLRALATTGEVPELVVFAPEGIDEALVPRAEGWHVVHAPISPMIAWEQFRLPRRARALGLDVVVTTSERSALFGPAIVPYIFEHPRRRAARQRDTGVSRRQRLVNSTTVALFALSMRRAAHVLAASEATADDLRWLTRLSVVPAGVSEEFHPDERHASLAHSALDAPGGYILHLASDDPRDNTELVLEAYAQLTAVPRPLLVIAGGVHALRPPLERCAAQLGIAESIRWPGFLSAEELVDAYRGAIAYVDPSLYEGFGLQALEAMACGTPVVTSNTTSLPEVVGDAGLLVDPRDAAGFASSLDALLTGSELHADYVRRGLERAATFTWRRTATQILVACRAVSEPPPARGATS
jgi:glycosyltransferase involved in cell wall biosynthesis